MGTTHLIDTNASIELLGELLTEPGENFLNRLISEKGISMSVINRIELLSQNQGNEELEKLLNFIRFATVWPLSESIIQQTILIRQTVRIKIPDAIIAATALVHNQTLVTRNLSDFWKIEGLSLLNLHELS